MIAFNRVMAEKRGWMLGTAMLALANVLVYVLGVLPLGARVAATDERAQNAARDVVAATAQLAQARRTVEGRVRANDQLRRFYADVLPVDQSAAREVTYLRLAQLARDARLGFDRRTFSIESEKTSALTRLDMSMELLGDYTEVRDFVYAVETAPEFVIIRRMSLQQNEREGTRLRLSFDVSTFFREARGQ